MKAKLEQRDEDVGAHVSHHLKQARSQANGYLTQLAVAIADQAALLHHPEYTNVSLDAVDAQHALEAKIFPCCL